MNIKTQYDKIGKKYIEEQKRFFTSRKDGAREFIRKNLGKIANKKVLDVGCGGGTDILIYEKLKADVYGIDPSKFMVNTARKVAKNPRNIKIGSADKIPFNKNFFDVVVGRFSLHYLPKFDKAYKEFFRVLKPGGALIMVVNHPFYDLFLQKKKVYGRQEVVSIKLYHGKVKIRFPSHTLSDYFSGEFFKLFELRSIYEEGDKEVPHLAKIAPPANLGFRAIKKHRTPR